MIFGFSHGWEPLQLLLFWSFTHGCVYSIDEVMIDATSYLGTYHMTARELARTMILDVLRTTRITATAGIGTNLYLCKVAMDIMAKHVAPDESGVRIAELDEMSYRRQLWMHRPLTDFWRERLCQKARGHRHLHHGRYRPVLHREGRGIL